MGNNILYIIYIILEKKTIINAELYFKIRIPAWHCLHCDNEVAPVTLEYDPEYYLKEKKLTNL